MVTDVFFVITLIIFGLATLWSWIAMNRQAERYAELVDYQSKAGIYVKTVERLKSPKPYKLIVAGNYGQFYNWVQSHIFNVYSSQHIVGRNLDEVEFIKVGDWQANEMVDYLKEQMTKEQWQEFLSDPVY